MKGDKTDEHVVGVLLKHGSMENQSWASPVKTIWSKLYRLKCSTRAQEEPIKKQSATYHVMGFHNFL